MKRQLGMFALCASLATASLAHEGHDHGDADKAPPIVGNQPQRLADGTVFIPKSAQRGMGVLTLKASSETVARSLELPGRVESAMALLHGARVLLHRLCAWLAGALRAGRMRSARTRAP